MDRTSNSSNPSPPLFPPLPCEEQCGKSSDPTTTTEIFYSAHPILGSATDHPLKKEHVAPLNKKWSIFNAPFFSFLRNLGFVLNPFSARTAEALTKSEWSSINFCGLGKRYVRKELDKLDPDKFLSSAQFEELVKTFSKSPEDYDKLLTDREELSEFIKLASLGISDHDSLILQEAANKLSQKGFGNLSMIKEFIKDKLTIVDVRLLVNQKLPFVANQPKMKEFWSKSANLLELANYLSLRQQLVMVMNGQMEVENPTKIITDFESSKNYLMRGLDPSITQILLNKKIFYSSSLSENEIQKIINLNKEIKIARDMLNEMGIKTKSLTHFLKDEKVRQLVEPLNSVHQEIYKMYDSLDLTTLRATREKFDGLSEEIKKNYSEFHTAIFTQLAVINERIIYFERESIKRFFGNLPQGDRLILTDVFKMQPNKVTVLHNIVDFEKTPKGDFYQTDADKVEMLTSEEIKQQLNQWQESFQSLSVEEKQALTRLSDEIKKSL